MSTRSVIRIVDKNGYRDLYHHFDGYPAGMGADLMQHVYPIIQGPCSNRYNKDRLAFYLISADWDDGYEDAGGIHPDIEYMYIVDLRTKEVRCLSGYYAHDTMQFKIGKEINLKEFIPVKQKAKYK